MAILDINQTSTICAAATPALPSALAVIRVSGPEAFLVRDKIFQPKYGKQQNFVATLGDIAGVDEGICISFPEGKSYTGEASFELSVHGSPVIVSEVLQALQEAGCRMAEPGEFSMRAVLNHKMDLCAAEAVCDLISSRSKEAASIALKNVKGGLGKYLYPVRSSIIDVLCEIEARMDFPDEDLGEKDQTHLLSALSAAAEDLKKLLAGASLGLKLTQGARILLFGLPNAGKSTLLNALLDEERALVHHLPGTTRDVVEAAWQVGGIPVSLVDVAGIRDLAKADTVEQLGIKKAQSELEKADGVLWLVDGSQGDAEQDYLAGQLEDLELPVLKVFTKLDLLDKPRSEGLAISAKTGAGLDALRESIRQLLVQDVSGQQEVLLTRERQKVLVQKAHDVLLLAYEALANKEVDEVVTAEIRSAGNALDELLGKSLNEDVLDLIFSRFCIGK